MHESVKLLLLTFIPHYVTCSTLDKLWPIFDYSSLQRFNITTLSPILNPPSFIEMAAEYGYAAESHEVTTEDGYILTVFHIRGNRPSRPVLLFHGVTDSADTWIIRGQTSLAVALANANYDIWLGNARGNRYSRRHRALDPDVDPDFWNFSFDEHGLYDLPATIDYVLNATGSTKLDMIGHSQGTVIMWVLLSTRPEYNDKINVATALAPIAFLQYIQPPVGTLIRMAPELVSILQAQGRTSLFGDDSKETMTIRTIAQVPVLGYQLFGYGLLFAITGVDAAEIDPNFLRTISLHTPTWTSVKNLAHYAQVSLSDVFGRYDYGSAGNLAAYNTTTAPLYRLGNVTARVALLAALNDKLAPIANVERLRRQLPNVVRYIINPRAVMNHVDFVWGRTAPIYLYGSIFEILENYN